MTDHIYGEDSFIECDRYSVVSQHRLDDIYPDGWNGETNCYCGADSVFIARVGFHTRLDDPDEDTWPRSRTTDVKVHRCEDHCFVPENNE